MEEKSFIDKVIAAFSYIDKETEKASLEHDIRPRFVKYFIEQVLGYSGSDYRYEKKRTDVTVFDENKFAIIKIETKKPSVGIDKLEHEEQAFKYEEETTRYIGLTNFVQFKLWEITEVGNELKINLNFSDILKKKDSLSTEEKAQILFFTNLTREMLFNPSKYEKFNETYKRIDITKESGFNKLLDRLNYIVNDLMMGYTLKTFEEYKEGYTRYLIELQKVDTEKKNNKGNKNLQQNIIRYRQQLDEKYKKYLSFSGFCLWKQFSGKENISDDNVKEIFCKETIYVLLNKLLFIRICEDKELLPKNISNGGIEDLRKHFTGSDDVYKEILHVAYRNAKKFYTHFYEPGLLDWYMEGDGKLNEILNKVLWILNQFDFTHVDRDILGNLYEKYLPPEERKELGEFYTPVEVIDYILSSINYTYNHDIESKDLLDPACGSGGFLVRAARKLISRYLMKFDKASNEEIRNTKKWADIVNRLSPTEAKIILEAIQDHVYGLDINPFACHIAEMNMYFQIIDLYKKVREQYKDYKIGKFKIYRTDSLELVKEQRQIIDFTHKEFLGEQEEINEIKRKKFDFVVGNPPYVRVHHMAEKYKKYLKENYFSPKGDFDIYICFIERGIEWIKPNGLLGFINSNKYLVREYGTLLRIFLLNNIEILQFVDISNCQIFKSAAVYPVINIFKRKTQQLVKEINIKNKFTRDIEIFFIKEDGLELLKNSPTSLKKKTNVIYHTMNQNIFYDEPDYVMEIHITLKVRKILDNLEKNGEKLVTLADNFCGTPRSKDYYEWGEKLSDNKPMGDFCKFIVSGNLKPYKIMWGKSVRTIGKRLTTPYLEYDKKLFTKDKWDLFKQKNKLVVRANDTRLTVAIDEDGFAGVGLYFLINIKIDPKYLMALLNSKLINFYYLSKFEYAHVSGNYISINGVHLDKIPIKIPETNKEKQLANQIIKKVNQILELYKKNSLLDIDDFLKNKKTEKLCNVSSVSFSIKDNTEFKEIKVHDNKIFINNEDYIEIKNKLIREFVQIYLILASEKIKKSKHIPENIYNILIPEADSVREKIILEGDIDKKPVEYQIKRLEKEIDDFVYILYDSKPIE